MNFELSYANLALGAGPRIIVVKRIAVITSKSDSMIRNTIKQLLGETAITFA